MNATKLTKQEARNIYVTVMMAICGMLGVDIHLSSIPHIMVFMHTDKSHMQQSVSIFLLGIGVSLLFYGPLSDQYGRKPVVIFGLSLAAASSFASVFTSNITIFLLTRLLQGAGSGVCLGLGRIIVADIVHGKRFAIITSYMSLFVSLSPLFAPALGGYIQHYFGWQANFLTLGSILTLLLVLYVVFCSETNKPRNPEACLPRVMYRNYNVLLLNPSFVGCVIISGIGMSISMVYATTSPFIFQSEFHLTPIAYGWLTAAVGMGGMLGKFLLPLFLRKFSSHAMLFLGLLLFSLSGLWIMFFIFIHSINVALVIFSVFVALFAQTLIFPNTAAKALSPFHDKRGAAGALYGCFQMLIAFLVSGAVGLLVSNGALVLSVSYFLLGIFGLCIYYWVFKTGPAEESPKVA